MYIYFCWQMHLQLKNSFFLFTDPDVSGSPPGRMPPRPDVKHSGNHPPTSPPSFEARGDVGVTNRETSFTPLKPVHGESPSLGLPCLVTGSCFSVLISFNLKIFFHETYRVPVLY